MNLSSISGSLLLAAAALAGCAKPDMPAEAAKSPAAQPPKVADAPVPARQPVWTVSEGVDTPESAYIDADSKAIYVSMIVGQPDQKDGNGRIAKLSMDGKMVSANWVTGLNAPKGLRVYKGTL